MDPSQGNNRSPNTDQPRNPLNPAHPAHARPSANAPVLASNQQITDPPASYPFPSLSGGLASSYQIRRTTCFNCGAFTHVTQYCPEMHRQHSPPTGTSRLYNATGGVYNPAHQGWAQQGWESGAIPQKGQTDVQGPPTNPMGTNNYGLDYQQSYGAAFNQPFASSQPWGNHNWARPASTPTPAARNPYPQPPGCQDYSTYPTEAPPPYNPPSLYSGQHPEHPGTTSHPSRHPVTGPSDGADLDHGNDNNTDFYGLDLPDRSEITGAYSGRPIRQLAEPLPQTGELADILSPLPSATSFERTRPVSILFRNLNEEEYLQNVTQSRRWGDFSLDPAFMDISPEGPSVSFEELERRRDNERQVKEESDDEHQQTADQESTLAALGVTGTAKPVDRSAERPPPVTSRRTRGTDHEGQGGRLKRESSGTDIDATGEEGVLQSLATPIGETDEEIAGDIKGKGKAAVKRERASSEEESPPNKRRRDSRYHQKTRKKKPLFTGDDPDVHPAFYRR